MTRLSVRWRQNPSLKSVQNPSYPFGCLGHCDGCVYHSSDEWCHKLIKPTKKTGWCEFWMTNVEEGMGKDIPKPLVESLRAWLGDNGIAFFTKCLLEYGTVSPVFHTRVPHPVHWREGMSVRNFMRRSGFCDNWTDNDLDEAWSRAVEMVITDNQENNEK